MKIIFVVGLPGSGKTSYAKTIGGVLVDDPKGLDDFPLERVDLLVVSDPMLCVLKTREEGEEVLRERYGDFETEYIFFENDPCQCLSNSQRRKDKPVEDSIFWLSSMYQIPEGIIPIKCWKPLTTTSGFDNILSVNLKTNKEKNEEFAVYC